MTKRTGSGESHAGRAPEIARVQALLEWDIACNAFGGRMLPDETVLSRRYQSTRNVTRASLAHLVKSRRIERVQGRGTVLRATPYGQTAAENVMIGAGSRAGGSIVRQEERPLPATLRDAFQNAEPDQTTLFTEWVSRTVDGPLEVAAVYLTQYRRNPLQFSEFDGDLFRFLAAHGHEAAEGDADIYATPADGWTARLLGIEAGEPVLVTQGVQRSAKGAVIAAGTHTFRAERVRMRFVSS